MDQERIWILLARHIAGEASIEEEEELEWAFLANPGLRSTLDLIQALKQAPLEGLPSGEEQNLLEKGLQRFATSSESRYRSRTLSPSDHVPPAMPAEDPVPSFSSRLPGHSRSLPLAFRWIAAASFLAIFIAGALVFMRDKHKPQAASTVVSKEVATKYGARTFILLPDSSRLWLNAGSKVRYADGFAGGKRELTLLGEAFFDVKHDVDRPFIIHAGKLDVRVLGTSLNIKAYPGDSVMETTLIKGKVEIGFAGNPRSKFVLRPSEKIVIHTDPLQIPEDAGPSAHISPSPSSIPVRFSRHELVPDPKDGTFEEISWVENKLVFRKESFGQLAMKLDRWYDVKILFEDGKYLQDRFTGAFKDQRIEEVMHALQITSNFQYRISGDTIRIW